MSYLSLVKEKKSSNKLISLVRASGIQMGLTTATFFKLLSVKITFYTKKFLKGLWIVEKVYKYMDWTKLLVHSL